LRESGNASFIEQLSSDPEVPAQVVPCLEEQIQKFSDEELQSFFVESDSSVAEELFGPCFGQ